MIAMQKEFDKEHENCKGTWKQPEPDKNLSVIEKMNFWLQKGEHGMSSETIFQVISGQRITDRLTHPYDPDDFRRCYLLIKAIPEWKEELYLLKTISPVWSKLVENWDKLTEMLEEQMKTCKPNGMYEFMHSLGC
jgi:hypothetical protein